MNLDVIVLVGGGFLILSSFVPFGKIFSFMKDKISKIKSTDDEVMVDPEASHYNLVDAVSKFTALHSCLERGEKTKALAALDKVFPLLNEEE